MQDVSYLIDVAVSQVRYKLTLVLLINSINLTDIDGLDSVFTGKHTKPFDGLQMFHHQLQFFKELFVLIVCSHNIIHKCVHIN